MAHTYIPLSSAPNSSEESNGVKPPTGRIRAWWSWIRTGAQGFTREHAGLLFITASQAFFSLVNVAVKTLNGIDPPVDTLQLIVVRMAITYICSVAYMLIRGVDDPWIGPKGVRLLLWFRGFSGFFGLFGVYFSLKYFSLSDATVLTFLAPFCTGIAGAVFLKERYTYREALAGLCSLLGVVLIARPAFLFGHLSATPDVSPVEDGVPSPEDDVSVAIATSEQRLVAVGVALVGVLGATGAYTTVRAIGMRAHALHSLASFSAQSVIVASIGMIIKRVPFILPTRVLWGLLLSEIGVFGFIAQLLLTMGLQRETAGRGVMAIYTQIIFATFCERIFFHSTPSGLSVLGTLIIIAAAIYVAFTKKKEVQLKAEDIALEEGLLSGAVEKVDAGALDDLRDCKESIELDDDDDELVGGPSEPSSPRTDEHRRDDDRLTIN